MAIPRYFIDAVHDNVGIRTIPEEHIDGIWCRSINVESLEYQITKLKTENKKLLDTLIETIKAWEALEGDKNYSPHVIEKWLKNEMKSAMDKCRQALKEGDK